MEPRSAALIGTIASACGEGTSGDWTLAWGIRPRREHLAERQADMP